MKCLSHCFNMDYKYCNRYGCECSYGFIPVLGGTTLGKTQAADLQLETDETGSSDDANWRTDFSSETNEWASFQSQGCTKDGLGHHSPPDTPYKISDVQNIDWSLNKACWISDKYVRYCDHYWSTDADSPQKCLEDCQNHEHCQKATWFLQEHEGSAGEPICVMFAVGAAECEWNGGEYVRPARGQSIECQGPECDPRRKNNCFDGSKTETYCKYTEMSAEDYDEMPEYSWSRVSSGLNLSPNKDRGSVSPYYADASRKYEYRCAACPKTPGQCTVYDEYPGDDKYPELSGSLSMDYHEEGWAECIHKCFNMDYTTCNDNGCNCLSSSEYNYQGVDQFGSFESILDQFASWNSAGCAHKEVTPPNRCWFVDDFDFYCDDDYGSFETETAEDCLLECTNNSTCYRAAWHPVGSSESYTTIADSTYDSGSARSGDSSAVCYMFQVGSQKCSWNDYVKKPDDARMIECIGEPCDWNHDEKHGGCGLEGQRAFCDLNRILDENFSGEEWSADHEWSTDNDQVWDQRSNI